MGAGLETSGLIYGYVVGSCGCEDELSGSKKCGKCLASWRTVSFWRM